MFSPQKISRSSWPFRHRAYTHSLESVFRIKEKTSNLSPGGRGTLTYAVEVRDPKWAPSSANRRPALTAEAPVFEGFLL